uniref:Uncharacterized protein n=1 Tax=Setaria italica TaxID=4555 RepID=K3YLX8_SETIT
PALHPYEEERLRQCMWNSARLKQLGIPALSMKTMNLSTKPSHDDTSEGDLIDDDNAKQASKEKSGKKTSDVPAGGVKFWSRKRVYPAAT